MRKGKHTASRRTVLGIKSLALVSALAVTVGCIVGGTVAWLTAKTNTISNTFVVGDIQLSLSEENSITADSEGNILFVPGQSWTKDTKVTVKGGSEKCYLFIHVDEKNNKNSSLTGKIIQWEFINDGWTQLTGQSGYYWRIVEKKSTDSDFYLIKDNRLTVNGNVTKDMVENLKANKPQISFTAAAIQFDHLPDKNNDGQINEKDAWELLPSGFKTTTDNP